jgi:hypothetical protein
LNLIRKRKAVQEILASLLLVGISVVGGLVTYLWAGDAFETSGTTLPQAQFAQMIGYDARDTSDIGGFSDAGANIDNDPAIGSLSTESGSEEFIVLQLRNTGVTPVIIDKIRIAGADHTFDSDTAGITDQPGVGTFEVYTKLEGDTSSKDSPIIEPSEDARVVIRLSNDIPVHIELGRAIVVKIYTQQGTVMNHPIIPGLSE